jgi:ATP synthase regulation
MSGEASKLPVAEDTITYDHHGEKLDDPTLKGFSRYFNNSTIRGRANVAKATVGTIFALILYRKFSTKKVNKNDKIVASTETVENQ